MLNGADCVQRGLTRFVLPLFVRCIFEKRLWMPMLMLYSSLHASAKTLRVWSSLRPEPMPSLVAVVACRDNISAISSAILSGH